MSRRFIKEFVGAHSGERAILLGNGPSLLDYSPADVDELAGSTGITIGINRCWQANDSRGFAGFTSPDYWLCVNSHQVVDYKVGAVTPTRCAFITDRLRALLKRWDRPWCTITRACREVARAHEIDPCEVFPTTLDGGYVGGFAGRIALELAAWMGFAQILLIGYDCGDNDGHHYPSPRTMHASREALMVPQFAPVARWADACGVAIINGSPASKILDFPRFTREELLRGGTGLWKKMT